MQAIRHKIKKATSTSKGKIIFSSILLVIILAITGGIVYWQTHKKKLIRERLEAAIGSESKGLYNVKYESLDLDEIGGYLAVSNLTLNYDSLKFDSLRKIGKAPSILLNITIPALSVIGVKTPRALIDKEIVGHKLEIKNPVIEIIYTMAGKDSARRVPTSEVYKEILGNLNQISVDTIVLSGMHITTRNLKTKRNSIELNNVTIQLADVKIDSAGEADPSRLLYAKDIDIAAESLAWISEDKRYKFGVKDIALNSTSRVVTVGNFSMDPQGSEEGFVKSLPTQDDRFDFSLSKISINAIDFPRMLKEEINAESITIGSASFKIYRDLNIPRDKKNRVGTYPHQAIADIPIPLYVKKMVLSSAFLEYKERNHITKNAGKVQFYNIYATINNLTNDKEMIAKDNTMSVDISTSFMNKTPFKASWLFYLNNEKGRFDVKGNMGSINAKELNAVTEPMGPARIEDGVINSVTFDLSGNNYSMNGIVKVLYDDLKVSLLEKDKGAKEWDKKGLTSFMANILIKNSNPRNKKEEPKVITVTNERDTNRSIFHLAWKTLFKGIQESVGIKAKAKPVDPAKINKNL